MFNKKINNYFLIKLIIIFFIFTLVILLFILIVIFYILSDSIPVNQKIRIEMACLNEQISTYYIYNKKYPKNLQELIKFSTNNKNKEFYKLMCYGGNIGLANLKYIPSEKDNYVKGYISCLVLSNSLSQLSNRQEYGTVLYYVNKSLTVYVIYGIEKNGKFYRKNEKIYYLTNQ